LEGGWVRYRGGGRRRALGELEDWVAERFRRHAGNADVVRQELAAEKGIKLSLRTIEREVAPLRRELEAEARATIRFETPAACLCPVSGAQQGQGRARRRLRQEERDRRPPFRQLVWVRGAS
jgi:hypothetical protein